MSKEITIAMGPCAVESYNQIMKIGYKGSLIAGIVKPYGIKIAERGGSWKPRTHYWVDNGNGEKEKVFEGTTLRGLIWHSEAGKTFGLPVVSELMSEKDIIYFDGTYTDEDLSEADFGSMEEDLSDLCGPENHFNGLDSAVDFIQIGARTSKAYALLHRTGKQNYGVVLKNPEHGVKRSDAEGSVERFRKTREIVYCTRGQLDPVYQGGRPTKKFIDFVKAQREEPGQHPDARNLNNIEKIENLREWFGNDISYWHDPSHTWGGKNNLMRRRIGEHAIKAITEYGYNGVIVEVDDESGLSRCDGPQALLTTLNGVDWSQTYVGEEPPQDELPITLVDIVKEVMDFQIRQGHVTIPSGKKESDMKRLDAIRWDATPF